MPLFFKWWAQRKGGHKEKVGKMRENLQKLKEYQGFCEQVPL